MTTRLTSHITALPPTGYRTCSLQHKSAELPGEHKFSAAIFSAENLGICIQVSWLQHCFDIPAAPPLVCTARLHFLLYSETALPPVQPGCSVVPVSYSRRLLLQPGCTSLPSKMLDEGRISQGKNSCES